MNIKAIILTLTGFIFLLPNYSYSQELTGQVLELGSRTSIPFVNIGIVGEDIGTVSNLDGEYQLNISEASGSDTLRFSYIGFQPYDIDVNSIRKNGLSSPILLEEKVFELNEITVESKKLVSKTVGVRKKDGHPIPLFRKAKTEVPFPQKNYRHEIGTLFSGNGFVNLDKVQINFSEVSIDTLDVRINVYSVQNGVFENILKEPVYMTITDLKKNLSPIVDLTELNLSLQDDFLITIENYQRIPNSSVRIFANLKSKGRSFPTYYRSNSQSTWTNLKVNSKDFGLSIQAYIRK
ncbi:MAG: carboxypeptidase-like regulatory domain-containing protein [Balneola sp.]